MIHEINGCLKGSVVSIRRHIYSRKYGLVEPEDEPNKDSTPTDGRRVECTEAYNKHKLMLIGKTMISIAIALYRIILLLRAAKVNIALSPTSHATTNRSRRRYSEAGSSFSSPATASALGLGS